MMTASELCAAQEKLGLSNEALAAELAVTPHVVDAWRAGSLAVPKKLAEELRWRAAIAERQAAVEASGLPACAWVREWEGRAVPTGLDAVEKHFKSLTTHSGSCATCIARDRYVEERFGPLPPPPSLGGFMGTVFLLLEKVPAWGRPAAAGAAILGAIVSLRLLFALPSAWSEPARLVEALIALVAAMGAGAAGGFAYSLTRPALRRLGRPGDYLTGIVCVFAYMGALAVVAPVAFGEPMIEDRPGLVIFAGLSVFFGLIVGHTWFRPDPPSAREPEV